MSFKQRLDSLLVERGYFSSRSRARDAIIRRTVKVEGLIASKAGQEFYTDAQILVDDPARQYVSRAALKLIAALEAYPIRMKGMNALDIGASTGGFTQVLLERGASHVFAIDVGHGQLDDKLKNNTSISYIEGLNARDLNVDHVGGMAMDLIVSDVSFISLKLAIPPALQLVKTGGQAVLLVKPQFEAGRELIGKSGVLKSPEKAEQIAANLYDWLNNQSGWWARGLLPSPIVGGDGNAEYLLYGEKTGG